MNLLQMISSTLQVIPDLRGKRRFCRIAIGRLGIDTRKNFVVHTRSGRFRLPNIKEAISFELFINGSYERGLVDMLAAQIPVNGVFLDIGANIGSISIPLAKRRKDLTIVAVEASPWIHEILVDNVRMNEVHHITTLNKAVFHTSGLRVPIFAPREYFGKGSLKPVYTDQAEQVDSITIADILQMTSTGKADFIKVDVEGFERNVFEGLPGECEAGQRPRIIFEYDSSTEQSAGFEPGDAQSVLLAKGYSLQGLDHRFRKAGDGGKRMIMSGYANILAS